MRAQFLPFSRPSITDAEIHAVTEVLRSGWITTGTRCSLFEEAFRRETGCPGAVALASATAGMHLLFEALNIGPGDEVVTPSMTWVSTVNLLVLRGARPVFADVERDTLMVSARTVSPCLSGRTRLVVPVHFAGAAVDMAPIEEMCRERGVFLAEDAAHALGTRHKDVPVGRARTSIFSFHPIKNITTGEGGMFCTDRPELLSQVQRLKFHGLGVDAHDRMTQGRSPQAEVQEPGYKYNLTDMAAALGLAQLARLETMNARREALAHSYRERLSPLEEILPLHVPETTTRHAWHLFVVRLDTEKARMSRDAFMEALKEKNIGTGLHFRAVHLQKYYREAMGFTRGTLPNTEWNSDRICSLPLFPDMTEGDVEDVVQAMEEVLRPVQGRGLPGEAAAHA